MCQWNYKQILGLEATQSSIPARLEKGKQPSDAELGAKDVDVVCSEEESSAEIQLPSVTGGGMTDNNCTEKPGGILLPRKNSSQQGKADAFRIRFSPC